MEFLLCVLYAAKDILALTCTEYILENFFSFIGRKSRFCHAVIFAGIAVYSAVGVFLLPEYTELSFEYLDGVSIIYAWTALLIIYRCSSKGTMTAVLCLFIFTVDMLWSFLLPLAGNSVITELLFDIIVFSGLAAAIRSCAKKSDMKIFSGVFREIPKWLIFVLLFFELTCYYREFGVSAAWYNFFYAVSACMVLLCISFLVLRICKLVLTQNRIMQQMNELLLSAEEKERSDNTLRSFRHDYKNHMIVMRSMFEQGNYNGAKEYFDHISGKITNELNRISTGNPIADFILSEKTDIASRNGIKIIFNGIIPPDGVDGSDICICTGNILDNAIEACEMLDDETQRIITVNAAVKNNTFIFTVKNPYNTNAEYKPRGRFPSTTKKDIALHGFGLKNIRNAAEKYGGEFTVTRDAGFFAAELLIPMRSSE